MSTVKTTNLQHPSSGSANIQLGSDGSVVLPSGFTGGLGTNVVQTVKTDTFTTSSTSFTALTGLSVSITPTSASSKILLLVSLQGHGTAGSSNVGFRLMRGATAINIGDAAGSRTQETGQFGWAASATGPNQQASAIFLDSPATAASVTYSVEVRSNAPGTAYINRTQNDSNVASIGRYVSSISAIEVAA